MSNKFNNHNNNNNKINVVSNTTKHLTKSGKLKGKNKRESKLLRRACPHFIYSKKNKSKLKPMFFNDGQGKCICKLCGASFPAKIANKSDVKASVETVVGYMNQAIAGAVSTNVSNKSIDKLAITKTSVKEFTKDYQKIMEIVSATDRVKNKKKKKNNSGNNAYGSWGSGRR